jgi:ABC-type sugar transport system substrate-binding protein
VRSDSRGALRRRAAALAAALGAAAASAVLIGGCSSPADVLTQKVLLTSGTYDNVWWGLWAWTDKREL